MTKLGFITGLLLVLLACGSGANHEAPSKEGLSQAEDMLERMDNLLLSWKSEGKGPSWKGEPSWSGILLDLGDQVLGLESETSLPPWLKPDQGFDFVVVDRFNGNGVPEDLAILLRELESKLAESSISRQILTTNLYAERMWHSESLEVLSQLADSSDRIETFQTLEKCAAQIWLNSSIHIELIFPVKLWKFQFESGVTRVNGENEEAMYDIAAFRFLQDSRSRLASEVEYWNTTPGTDSSGVTKEGGLEVALVVLEEFCRIAEQSEPMWSIALQGIGEKGQDTFLRSSILLNIFPLQDWKLSGPVE